MAEETYSSLTINGTKKPIEDTAARKTANDVTAAEEYDRQHLTNSYAGRSLASVFAAEISAKGNIYAWLQSRVRSAVFTGLRIGDYMDVPTSDGKTIRYRIGAIDPYLYCGDTSKGHHIVMVPSAPVAVSGDMAVNGSYIMWNATATNQGTAEAKNPYLCSQLHDWEINTFLPTLPSELQAVMMNHRVLLEERYSSSGALTESNSWSWQDLGKVWSPSEMEVYGCPVWGTKGYSVGFDCQFPIFADTAARINGTRVTWWLRSVMGGSSSSVCIVHGNGHASYIAATYTWVRPLPCFLIG